MNGSVEIDIGVYAPDRRRRDVDNVQRACLTRWSMAALTTTTAR